MLESHFNAAHLACLSRHMGIKAGILTFSYDILLRLNPRRRHCTEPSWLLFGCLLPPWNFSERTVLVQQGDVVGVSVFFNQEAGDQVPTHGKSQARGAVTGSAAPSAAPCHFIKATELWLLLIYRGDKVIFAMKKTIKEGKQSLYFQTLRFNLSRRSMTVLLSGEMSCPFCCK